MTTETTTATIPTAVTPDLTERRTAGRLPAGRPRSRRTFRLASAGLALALAAGLAACGESSSSGTAAKGANDPVPTAGTATAVSAEFCDAAIGFGAVMGGAPQDPSAIGPFVQQELQPATEALVAALPSDLAEAGRTLTTAVQQAADTGDPSGIFGPEGGEAQAAIGRTVHEGCEVQPVSVHAVEYAFHGVPATLSAGPTSFELTNDGVEEHEMVLFKRADGATESLSELLELPEEEAMAKMQFTGVAFGGPGSTSYATADLEPGTYFLVCFIPTGGEQGPPHFMSGMQQTITVA